VSQIEITNRESHKEIKIIQQIEHKV